MDQIYAAIGSPPNTDISMLSIGKDTNTGRVWSQFHVVTDDITIESIRQKFYNGDIYITAVINDTVYFNVTCGKHCPGLNIYVWTDYGDCPDQPCMNGGRCGMSASGNYFCSCRLAQGHVGKYCETKPIDLTPILIVPIVIGLMMALLAALWCLTGILCAPPPPAAKGPPVIEEVVKEIPEPVCMPVAPACHQSVIMDDWSEPARQLPEQTYYHALGTSFPLVFNTRTYSGPGSMLANQRCYGSLGRRSRLGGALPAGMSRPTAEMLGTLRANSSSGNSSFGTLNNKKYVVAFNDRTFQGGNYGPGSVLHGQPY
jgi:hypothetical protein